MSPEQARGEVGAVSPATDVWGLGATLYEMLTGAAPFRGASQFEVWSAIVGSDPEPPRRRNPRVHADIEAICLKCLEKAPARRYASARALADDLGRFLAGEPIEAERPTAARRLWRRLVRRRAVVLPSAVAALLAIALLAWWGAGEWRRRAAVADALEDARRFSRAASDEPDLAVRKRLYEEARDALAAVARDEAEASSRLADVRGRILSIERAREEELARAKQALAKAERVSKVLSRWARLWRTTRALEEVWSRIALAPGERRTRAEAVWGPVREFMEEFPESDAAGHAASLAFAGWARRLAGHPEEGEEWMRESSRLDPDLPYGALLRAMARFDEYVRLQRLPVARLGEAGVGIGPPRGEESALAPIRAEIAALLDEAERAPVWGKGEAAVYRGAVGAVRALQAGEYAAADEALSEAVDAPELRPMRTSLLLARAKVRFLRKRFGAAIEDIAEVLELREGSSEAWDTSGLIRQGEAAERDARGEDPIPALDRAIEDFGKAIERAPAAADPFLSRAVALEQKRGEQVKRGIDAGDTLRREVADLDNAVSIDPENLYARINRGSALVRLGEARAARGEDAIPTYRQAIEDLEKAIALDPRDACAWLNLGNARQSLGAAREARGEDPRESYLAAVQAVDEAVRVAPADMQAYVNRGNARVKLGQAQGPRGEDPRKTFEGAIADAEEALRRAPGDPSLRRQVALVRYAQGRAEALASGGGLGGVAPDAEEGARLRERALRYLRAAIEAGFADAERMQGDGALAGLRDDPRFAELLSRIHR